VPGWLSIVFGIFGVVGVLVAVAGELRARRERAQRHAAERRRAAAERERAQLQALLDAPEMTVDYAGYSREPGGLQRLMIKVTLTNKGPTVAKHVEFGVHLGSWEGQAGPNGIAQAAAAVAPGEQLVWRVLVPPEVERAQLRHQLRVEDEARPWIRFVDKRGDLHQVPRAA
jgi:hypothetical protein